MITLSRIVPYLQSKKQIHQSYLTLVSYKNIIDKQANHARYGCPSSLCGWGYRCILEAKKWPEIIENYLTANEPEHRVAHIPPIVAPGPVNQTNVDKLRH